VHTTHLGFCAPCLGRILHVRHAQVEQIVRDGIALAQLHTLHCVRGRPKSEYRRRLLFFFLTIEFGRIDARRRRLRQIERLLRINRFIEVFKTCLCFEDRFTIDAFKTPFCSKEHFYIEDRLGKKTSTERKPFIFLSWISLLKKTSLIFMYVSFVARHLDLTYLLQ
jgi:hypothetical protein